jgi:hypothetical protein
MSSVAIKAWKKGGGERRYKRNDYPRDYICPCPKMLQLDGISKDFLTRKY